MVHLNSFIRCAGISRYFYPFIVDWVFCRPLYSTLAFCVTIKTHLTTNRTLPSPRGANTFFFVSCEILSLFNTFFIDFISFPAALLIHRTSPTTTGNFYSQSIIKSVKFPSKLWLWPTFRDLLKKNPCSLNWEIRDFASVCLQVHALAWFDRLKINQQCHPRGYYF